MASIFDGKDYWDMAEATSELGKLVWFGPWPTLTHILRDVECLGDPYYMDLSPATYKVAAGL